MFDRSYMIKLAFSRRVAQGIGLLPCTEFSTQIVPFVLSAAAAPGATSSLPSSLPTRYSAVSAYWRCKPFVIGEQLPEQVLAEQKQRAAKIRLLIARTVQELATNAHTSEGPKQADIQKHLTQLVHSHL